MAIPCLSLGEREQFIVLRLLPGFFYWGTRRECQAQTAFVWSKQCPFTSTFKNQANQVTAGAKSYQIQFIRGKIRKYPCAFYEVSYMPAEDRVTSLLGLIQQCVQQELSSVAGRGLLVTQSLSSIHCNSGKWHFSILSSPLSSDKISTDLTEALTYKTSTGYGSFSRREKETLDFSSKGCNSSLQSSMQEYFALAFSITGHRTSSDVSVFCQGNSLPTKPGMHVLCVNLPRLR